MTIDLTYSAEMSALTERTRTFGRATVLPA